MAYILGVDIGTQGIKGVLLDEQLQIVARAYREHEYLQPRPTWFEHDGEATWWAGFTDIVHQLRAIRSFAPTDILGVGCSGVTPCLLPTDQAGKPLRNAILYGIDTRSTAEVEELTRQLGAEHVLELTRMSLSNQFVGPKIIWYKKHEPDRFKRTKKIFTTTNYIIYKLTGNCVLDHAQAALFSPFYQYDQQTWNEGLCERLGIPLTLFPELKQSYEIAGVVTPKAAEATGLSPQTPVIVGTCDSLAEAVSTGGFGKGEVTLIYGTTGLIVMTTERSPAAKELWILPHPVLQNSYMAAGGTATTGALTKWFRDNFGDVEKRMQHRNKVNAYTLLGEQAQAIPPGSDGLLVLPYFCGERTPLNDPLARGVIMGLTVSHSRAHLYRALLEGAAYSFQHHFDVFRRYGFQISKVFACGGGAKCPVWPQIVTDVLGYDQVLLQAPLGSEIGSAYLVAQALGLIDNIQAHIIRASGKRLQTTTVNRRNHALYQEYYRVYRTLYGNIQHDMHTLARIAERHSG
jgi:xylulokinase